MSSLREKFTDKANKKAEQKRNKLFESTNGYLLWFAGKLKKKMIWHSRLHPHNNEKAIPIYDLSIEEVKALAGYKQLHKACASNDVDMKIEVQFSYESSAPQIIITKNKPYSESPDAAILGALPASPSKAPKCGWRFRRRRPHSLRGPSNLPGEPDTEY